MDDRSELYVCDSNFAHVRVQVYEKGFGAHLAGPFDCSHPEHDVTFHGASEKVLDVLVADAMVELAAREPNPATSSSKFRFTPARRSGAA